jgi:hypothetical protein
MHAHTRASDTRAMMLTAARAQPPIFFAVSNGRATRPYGQDGHVALSQHLKAVHVPRCAAV